MRSLSASPVLSSTPPRMYGLMMGQRYDNYSSSNIMCKSNFSSQINLRSLGAPPVLSSTPPRSMATNNNGNNFLEEDIDRLEELKAFDHKKIGVKGLVDSGITQVPPIFVHPPEMSLGTFDSGSNDPLLIPLIDLSSPQLDLVKQVKEASCGLGFFMVTNHGIPLLLLDCLINSVRAFHELPNEEKVMYYRKDMMATGAGVGFRSNFDLYKTKAASWRDTLEVGLGPMPVDSATIPHVCREAVMEWDKEVKQLAFRLMGLLSLGLGLRADSLNGFDYIGRESLVGHYYPYCPEPSKTIGIVSHTDPWLLTVVLQDQVGGLQFKHEGKWHNLKPIHGALVIFIGDLLQMVSNDIYVSREHRVIPHPEGNSRVSVATNFSPGIDNKLCGPLPELISPQNPALYDEVLFCDYNLRFITKELDGKRMRDHFRL